MPQHSTAVLLRYYESQITQARHISQRTVRLLVFGVGLLLHQHRKSKKSGILAESGHLFSGVVMPRCTVTLGNGDVFSLCGSGLGLFWKGDRTP
jgi:hypothetical protein